MRINKASSLTQQINSLYLPSNNKTTMEIAEIFERNKKWVTTKLELDADFFSNISKQQKPDYLYIGCSDSRVTAEELMGVSPGDVFVHRNIANLVPNLDLNVQSVINYAVRHLEVKHIIVCGHYGCGGVQAAMKSADLGILNPWLRNIRDVYRLHQTELDSILDDTKRFDRLVELNVQEQCVNVSKLAAIQQGAKLRVLKVHGWVFDMRTGYLKDLKIPFDQILSDIKKIYKID